MTRPTLLLILAAVASGGPEPLAAQTVQGRVLLEGDSTGVEGVDLLLSDLQGVALLRFQSDLQGYFRFSAPFPGRFQLTANRIGLRESRVELRVGDKEMVEVELRMAEEAIPLEPIVVTARRRIVPGTLDEFYDRMTRMKQAGRGWFLTRAEMEANPAANLEFMLYQAPGLFLTSGGGSSQAIQMRRPGSYCTPDLYIDGLPADYGRFPEVEDLEGVEVYRGRFEPVPGYWPSDCGTIFLWRKPDWGRPFSWKALFMAGGLAGIGAALAALLF